MCELDSIRIDLKAIGEEAKTSQIELDDAYFQSLEGAEVERGNVHIDITVKKSAGIYELDIHHQGTVIIPCDRCLDDMEQEVEADNRLLARLGEEYSEDDDMITVDKDDAILDVAWIVYEFIALSIPVKHVHAPGKCNRAMIEAIEAHSATRSGGEEYEKPIDPRWSALQKLKE